MTPSELERIALLEYKNSQVEKELAEINSKLTALLALRDKGMGAFWLASALIGTGIVGLFLTVIDWLKGH